VAEGVSVETLLRTDQENMVAHEADDMDCLVTLRQWSWQRGLKIGETIEECRGIFRANP
jgi:hypothetical protein